MRELTKAVSSLFLAASLFGVKQVQDVLLQRRPRLRSSPATQAVVSVTAEVLDELNRPLRITFEVLDPIQRFFTSRRPASAIPLAQAGMLPCRVEHGVVSGER